MAKLAFVPPLADAILAEFPARAELPLPLPLVLVVRAHRLARVAQRLVGRCRAQWRLTVKVNASLGGGWGGQGVQGGLWGAGGGAEWRLTVNVDASITKGEANGGRG